eukprot:TRINITY_DN14701_c0_g1_i2.p1 TRINITY_DN14701_c0_g1~~TRINITY_DN14701_c0_g1_i2.p1  ORF type:complete len:525 (+),score=91.98 TRINITY_DN14701_c0_g1_i2:166-1740(+)
MMQSQRLSNVRVLLKSCAQTFCRTFDIGTLAFLCVLLLATSPDLSQIALVLAGAGLCYLVQAPRASSGVHIRGGQAVPSGDARGLAEAPERSRAQCRVLQVITSGKGWEVDVSDFLRVISPTPRGNEVLQRLTNHVKKCLQQVVPEVEVTGFASGDLVWGTTYGLAIPDVDIVVNVRQEVLQARSMGKVGPLEVLRAAAGKGPEALKGMSDAGAIANDVIAFTGAEAKKLQKSAIRSFTDRLVGRGGYKFRRSAFRGLEPKVTLLAPLALDFFDEAIPFDFSVNGNTPHYGAALLDACGALDSRARDLIVLVRRWSKERGVCHVAKGHLSTYAWSILAIYFLQSAEACQGQAKDGGPLLPVMEDFDLPLKLRAAAAETNSSCAEQPRRTSVAAEAQHSSAAQTLHAEPEAAKKTIAGLFHDFFDFYANSFDWRHEIVCIRRGTRRGPTSCSSQEVGPNIQDPFESDRNLGQCTTGASLERLHQELRRAAELSSGEQASLEQLLEPWAPPDRLGATQMDEGSSRL